MAQQKVRARGRREGGQALVEFALVIPLFLLLVMSIVDFGWALRAYVTVTNSAREGARLGIVCPGSDDDIKNKVRSASDDLVDTANVTVVWETGTRCDAGHYVQVTATYDYNYITPLGDFLNFVTGGTLPSPLHMSTVTKMRVE